MGKKIGFCEVAKCNRKAKDVVLFESEFYRYIIHVFYCEQCCKYHIKSKGSAIVFYIHLSPELITFFKFLDTNDVRKYIRENGNKVE